MFKRYLNTTLPGVDNNEYDNKLFDAKKNLIESFNKSKTWYDEKHKTLNKKYEIGQEVYLRNNDCRSKSDAFWIGDYSVSSIGSW